jgi:predicted lipoprotein
VNDVSDAIFYIEKFTKDAKLATPLGVFANDCGLEACAENVESRFAYHSLQNIISNIQGLNMIFLGGETDAGVGFDDYLLDVGATDTAEKMRGDLAEVIEFALSLQTSLAELLVQDPEQVQQVHDQLKDVTDNMKTDFIQRLALELPATSAGDND